MITAGHKVVAVAVLAHRTKVVAHQREEWRPLALELATASELIRGGQMTSHYWKVVAETLVENLPGEIVAAIFRAQRDRSAGTWFAAHSEAGEVLFRCADANPSAVWRVLKPHLEDAADAFLFSIGFPRGMLDRLPSEDVLTWVDQSPSGTFLR